ncbi:MAG TPA: energy transducer TonB [Candidatus Acidoferrales bacterium]
MGTLSGCILENDPETQEKARWLRGKSLVASTAIEAAVVLALLAWPLLSPGGLGDRLLVTPVPPYGGNGAPTQSRRPEHYARSQSEPSHLCLFCARPAAPSHPPDSGGDNVAPGGPPDVGLGPGNGTGPLIPGADANNSMPIEIKKPEPPQRPALQHISEGVMTAALIYKVQPEYPAIARLSHLSGTVRLRAIIGTDGRIQQLEVLSGSPFFQAAAVAAVRQWRYRPTMLSGTPVEVETLITVNFVLNEP